jgi:hypothetical protein
MTGRYLPLIYQLISTLISARYRYAVVVIDAEGRFDATRLVSAISSTPIPVISAQLATMADLKHVHVYHPPRSTHAVQATLAAAEGYMLYGRHTSRDRKWWGTMVIGDRGGDVNADWKGWLQTTRGEVPVGLLGTVDDNCVEDALAGRGRRQDEVDQVGWIAREATGRLGAYVWRE